MNQNLYNLSRLRWMLIILTLLFIAAQLAFFAIHYQVSELIDSLASSSIASALWQMQIMLPLSVYIFLQCIAYALLISWIWFVAVAVSQFFKLKASTSYFLGLSIWCLHIFVLLLLNARYYPQSFFAKPFFCVSFLFYPLIGVLSAFGAMAYLQWWKNKCRPLLGFIFLLFPAAMIGLRIYDAWLLSSNVKNITKQPNIIFIGLDSLRPDFTGYFGNKNIHTPTIDQFLKSANVFEHAYSPLARTYPAWMSILSAQYPMHHHARFNMSGALDHSLETITQRLHKQGYETIYATDEPRFTDIDGFDVIIGPKGGAAEFLLAGISDFPLSNLLVNLPIGRILFPYLYGNRGAEMIYEPQHFLQLLNIGLAHRENKPLFLSVHLCLGHWPFTWAQSKVVDGLSLAQRYERSVETLDVQLKQLLTLLDADGLLENSIVVLLSDHGVTLGLANDRVITKEHYIGNAKDLSLIPLYRAGNDLQLNTSYGQGTDVLSLKQHQILLGMKIKNSAPKRIPQTVTLLDIAPTILDVLQMQPLLKSDGFSRKGLLMNNPTPFISQPAMVLLESADKVASLESEAISMNKVVKETVTAYEINKRGQLQLRPELESAMIGDKQRAVLWGDWLLARYPAEERLQLQFDVAGAKILKHTNPPFMVVVNLKSQQWNIITNCNLI